MPGEEGEPAEDAEPTEEEVTDPEAVEGEEPEETEGEPEEEAEEVPELNPILDLRVNADPATLQNGDILTCEAVITDMPEDIEYTVQWQESNDDGANWMDIQDATGTTFSVEMTEENIYTIWRYVVRLADEA